MVHIYRYLVEQFLVVNKMLILVQLFTVMSQVLPHHPMVLRP